MCLRTNSSTPMIADKDIKAFKMFLENPACVDPSKRWTSPYQGVSISNEQMQDGNLFVDEAEDKLYTFPSLGESISCIYEGYFHMFLSTCDESTDAEFLRGTIKDFICVTFANVRKRFMNELYPEFSSFHPECFSLFYILPEWGHKRLIDELTKQELTIHTNLSTNFLDSEEVKSEIEKLIKNVLAAAKTEFEMNGIPTIFDVTIPEGTEWFKTSSILTSEKQHCCAKAFVLGKQRYAASFGDDILIPLNENLDFLNELSVGIKFKFDNRYGNLGGRVDWREVSPAEIFHKVLKEEYGLNIY